MSDRAPKDYENQLRQQMALSKFGERALTSDNLDEILTEACTLVGEALGTDLAKVMELQDDGETLLVRAGVGWKPGVVGKVTLRRSDNTSEGLALQTGEPMISVDIATEHRFSYPQFLTDNGVRAVANVVIIGGSNRPAYGILQIDSRVPRQFTTEDTSFLRSYANLLAAAVSRLRVIGEVREGKERLTLALELGELGSWELDIASGIINGSRQSEKIFGCDDPASLWSYDVFLDHVLPEDRTLVGDVFSHAINNGMELSYTCRIRRKNDGIVRVVEARGRPIGSRGNALPTHIVGIVADVTDRRRAEETLQQSNDVLLAQLTSQQTQRDAEARFRFATEAGRLGVWDLDLRSGELSASDTCKRNFGRDGAPEFTYADLLTGVHLEDRDRVRAAIEHSAATGAEFDVVCRIVRPDGSIGWVQMHAQVAHADDGPPYRMAGISLDITQRVLTEERIRQSQRIEAVGRLTAGVAHDVNNVLQVLLGSLEMSLDEVRDRPELRASLELALQAGQRGARLTSHLLSFSRQQVLHPAALQLLPVLQDLAHTLDRTLGRDIDVRVNVAPGLSPVFADAAHLDSALLNLALNARDAMPQGGTITFEAYAAPEQVVIAILDTGAGMTPEVLAHACEPFFSTKGVKGSGLGLSMAQGFASQSGGELRIQSVLEKGTRIEIWLPTAMAQGLARPVAQAQLSRGKGRILVVDDDPDVARITAAFLRKAGFDVTTVNGGNEALAALSPGGMFEALVTDYAMPGLNGVDLLLEVHELHPGLPALIITGYAGAEGLERLPENVAVLRKPFQREELVARVAAILAKSPDADLITTKARLNPKDPGPRCG